MTQIRTKLSLQPDLGHFIVLMLFINISPVVFTQVAVNCFLFSLRVSSQWVSANRAWKRDWGIIYLLKFKEDLN